ncbi:hypothetical protein [Chitinophaga rhizophila]|uniref:GLPGLI family protein n=1 Tax=Chitinophaga rhizophila TaxID=2866212 RepID=A0ABS7GFJ6_9BACT|nr:hypothetical protein [Chitinophaga rhizophila]MBW8686467.1 hypothetical protein [Chitinophaga rhizophila]
MRQLLFPLLLILVSTNTMAQHSFYVRLRDKDMRHLAMDTAGMSIGDIRVYLNTGSGKKGVHYCGQSSALNTILLEKTIDDKKVFYQLNTNVDFLNDSTLIEYSFIPENTSSSRYYDEGVWVLVKFKKNKPQLEIDKKPEQAVRIPIVNGTGIYYYASDTLQKVSNEQSYTALCKLKQDGYYYLPSLGRLYTLHSIDEVK